MGISTHLLIAGAGALGTLARFGLSELMVPASKAFPMGTLTINVLGSLIIGFFGTLTLANSRYAVSEDIRLLVMVGFCGGFTTFSAFSLQTFDLIRSGFIFRAVAYAVLSVALCVIAVAAGHAIANLFNSGATQIAQIEVEEEA